MKATKDRGSFYMGEKKLTGQLTTCAIAKEEEESEGCLWKESAVPQTEYLKASASSIRIRGR